MASNPNDPNLRSFIEVAPDSDFPIQNLPFGVFSTEATPQKRVGIAIGDFVLDAAELERCGLVTPAGRGTRVFDRASINAYMALGPKVWSESRASRPATSTGAGLRLNLAQRLAPTRQPALGAPAPRAVSREGLRYLDQPLGGHPRGAGAVPHRRAGARPRAPALSRPQRPAELR